MPRISPFLLVGGARPNFMKIAPLARAMKKRKVFFRFMNTGQHHDPALSDVFFRDLGLGKPDFNLEVGSGSHAQTTARVMERAEPILQKIKPRAVIVVGDVNSTLALALTATKLHLPVVHVEAGLRSRDWRMPEEINRILTDRASDLLLTHSPDADQNLRKEGTPASKIVRVGNIMIDSLVKVIPSKKRRQKSKKDFFIMTFHRPSNVDSEKGLKKLIQFLRKASSLLPIELPLHPRTRVQLEKFQLWDHLVKISHLKILAPLQYPEFVKRMSEAKAVVTDSGGVQEETTYLGIPCLIMRTTTERPICMSHGTAELMGENYELAIRKLKVILSGKWKRSKSIPLWDGKTADRIVRVLLNRF